MTAQKKLPAAHETSIVGNILFNAAKRVVVEADQCDHFYMVHADDYNALKSAVSLVERTVANPYESADYRIATKVAKPYEKKS